MSDLLLGLLAGAMMGIPLGPMALSCVELQRDRLYRIAFAVIAGGVSGDMLAGGTILSAMQFTGDIPDMRELGSYALLNAIGGLLLVVTGGILIQIMVNPPKRETPTRILLAYFGALLVSIAEVSTWMALAAVFALVGVKATSGWPVILGLGLGAMMMWYGVTRALASLEEGRAKAYIRRAMYTVCAGFIMLGCGVLALSISALVLPAAMRRPGQR